MSPLQPYNTRTRARQTVVPADPGGQVGLLVCGPTVYDLPHLGHAKTYIHHEAEIAWMETDGGLGVLDIDTDRLMQEREQHRRNRRFADADRIRDHPAAHDVILEDSMAGVR